MRVRCIKKGHKYVKFNQEYSVFFMGKNGEYYFDHMPYHSYPAQDFIIVSNDGKAETSVEHRISQLENRLLNTETRLRQMQDQLDNHDHKTNIDFTVEREN